MRALFLVLLLGNAGFFAWSRYVSPADGEADPAPLSRQIEPDRLRIVSPADLPPPAPKPGPTAAPAERPASLACLEWGSFTLAETARAEKALESLALGSRLAPRRTDELAGWWVFIPPQGSRQNAVRKAAELKALGVNDYFVVQEEGEFRWAISLGIFRNEQAAQSRLAGLQEQGVRTARAEPRETLVPKVWLQVKGVDAGLESRLKEIARQLEGSELRPCPLG